MTGFELLGVVGVGAAACVAIGVALGRLAEAPADDPEAALVARVNARLPQTQCAQCGYPGCRPYADAIVRDGQAIDRCPPGGEVTIAALASLLGREAGPVDPNIGTAPPPSLAVIDESRCIGCALCLPACPVDAIVGAPRYLHTVLERDCTGCELCIAPCPVDCIELVPKPVRLDTWQWPRPVSLA